MTATKKKALQIWVDADSCPAEVRDLLIRWRERRQLEVEFLAARQLTLPGDIPFSLVTNRTVDEEILSRLSDLGPAASAGIIIVTRDIPLAERCLARGAIVINDRGDQFDAASVRERRSIRDASAGIRAAGLEEMDGRRRYGKRELKRFADTLDRVLAHTLR